MKIFKTLTLITEFIWNKTWIVGVIALGGGLYFYNQYTNQVNQTTKKISNKISIPLDYYKSSNKEATAEKTTLGTAPTPQVDPVFSDTEQKVVPKKQQTTTKKPIKIKKPTKKRPPLAIQKVSNIPKIQYVDPGNEETSIIDKFNDEPPNKNESTLPTKLERTLPTDRMIHAQIYNDIDSQSGKFLLLIVTRHVYSAHGRTILIPAGSRIRGEYNNAVKLNETRLQMSATSIRTPEGVYIKLENNSIQDLAGAEGVIGNLNQGLVRNFTIPLIFSLATSLSTAAAAGASNSIFDYLQTKQILTEEAASANKELFLANQSAANLELVKSLIDNYIKVNPIIKLTKGAEVILFPNKNIVIKELPDI